MKPFIIHTIFYLLLPRSKIKKENAQWLFHAMMKMFVVQKAIKQEQGEKRERMCPDDAIIMCLKSIFIAVKLSWFEFGSQAKTDLSMTNVHGDSIEETILAIDCW